MSKTIIGELVEALEKCISGLPSFYVDNNGFQELIERAKAADRETEYEQLKRRFQNYCKHDGGKLYLGAMVNDVCAICGWEIAKCQHRRSKPGDNYCIDCGAKLKDEGGAA